MIIEAFLRWMKDARVADRSKAANALGRAYVQSAIKPIDEQAAELAMTYVLDDPSPKVRLALAEALVASERAPRHIILSLAQDQAEISSTILLGSPCLTDADLIDIMITGTNQTHAMIALRRSVSAPVSAALVEVCRDYDAALLLQNPGANIPVIAFRRLAERFATHAQIRELLLDRAIPEDARLRLVDGLSQSLAQSTFIQNVLAPGAISHVMTTATDDAVICLQQSASQRGSTIIQYLHVQRRLTPAFFMTLLHRGELPFLCAIFAELSGTSNKRVRSILADGRMQAVQNLLITCGMSEIIAADFAHTVILWRQARPSAAASHMTDRRSALGQLERLAERLAIADKRSDARGYAARQINVAA